MYLPQQEDEGLFKKHRNFSANHGLSLKPSTEIYSGAVENDGRIKNERSGTTAGSSYQFGVNSAKEIKSFGKEYEVG